MNNFIEMLFISLIMPVIGAIGCVCFEKRDCGKEVISYRPKFVYYQLCAEGGSDVQGWWRAHSCYYVK